MSIVLTITFNDTEIVCDVLQRKTMCLLGKNVVVKTTNAIFLQSIFQIVSKWDDGRKTICGFCKISNMHLCVYFRVSVCTFVNLVESV